jgi:hypothetical protein
MPISEVILTVLLASTPPQGDHHQTVTSAADAMVQPSTAAPTIILAQDTPPKKSRTLGPRNTHTAKVHAKSGRHHRRPHPKPPAPKPEVGA